MQESQLSAEQQAWTTTSAKGSEVYNSLVPRQGSTPAGRCCQESPYACNRVK